MSVPAATRNFCLRPVKQAREKPAPSMAVQAFMRCIPVYPEEITRANLIKKAHCKTDGAFESLMSAASSVYTVCEDDGRFCLLSRKRRTAYVD